MTTEEHYAIPFYKGIAPEMRQIYGKSMERPPYFRQLKERENEEKGLERNYDTKNMFQVLVPPVKFIPGYTGHLPGKNDVFGKTFTQQVEECLNNLAKIRKMNEERMKMLAESTKSIDQQYHKMDRPSSSPHKDLLDKRFSTPHHQEFRPQPSQQIERQSGVQFTNYPSINNCIEPPGSHSYNVDKLSVNKRTERPKTCGFMDRPQRNPEDLLKELKYESPFTQKYQKDQPTFGTGFDPRGPNSVKDPAPVPRMRYSPIEDYKDYKRQEDRNYSGYNPENLGENGDQECNYRKISPTRNSQSCDELNTLKGIEDIAEKWANNPSYDFKDHHQKDYMPHKTAEDNEKSLGASDLTDLQLSRKLSLDQLAKIQDTAENYRSDNTQNNVKLTSTHEQIDSHLRKDPNVADEPKENLDSSLIASGRRPSTGFYRNPIGVPDKSGRYINWDDYTNYYKGMNLRRPNFYRTTYDDFNNAARNFNPDLNSRVFGNRGYRSRLNSSSYFGAPPMNNIKL